MVSESQDEEMMDLTSTKTENGVNFEVGASSERLASENSFIKDLNISATNNGKNSMSMQDALTKNQPTLDEIPKRSNQQAVN